MKQSIIPGDVPGQCYICKRRTATQCHHCLHGSRRKAADRYGLTVHLCPTCHMELHDKGKYDLALEMIAQEAFEDRYGREEWMRIFGKSWR
jgi:hypothetical protein